MLILCLCRGETGRFSAWAVKPVWCHLAQLVLLCLKQTVRCVPQGRGKGHKTGGSVQGSTRSQCPLLLMPRRPFVHPPAPPGTPKVVLGHFSPKTQSNRRSQPPPSPILQILTRNMAENLVHLSKGCLIVFLFNSNVPHTPSGVRVPLQHLWVPKALRRELSGRNPTGMFPPHGTSSEFCSSSATGLHPFDFCEGESCTSSLGIWQLCHHQLTLLTPSWGKSRCSHCFWEWIFKF